MSDPNFKAEEAPPPQPPRPQRTQLEQDEIYARQLAEHYQNQGGGAGAQSQQRRQHPSQRPNEPDREHSFFDGMLTRPWAVWPC
jgi:hypothetical protein